MSIVEHQMMISDKVVSNDIATDPGAKSLTMRSGYYADYKYPDNRSEITGESFSVKTSQGSTSEVLTYIDGEDIIVTIKDNSLEEISESKTAAQIG